ncbi:MAG: MerR family transcriptional regulator [bacterium]|nr:MerR family transcriptional regulator [bacterium]
MIRIGDFSKLTNVSIRMLRHYDELGLLRPAHVDAESGYRYYAAEQLPRLHRIRALQDLGFSLEQVGELLRQPLTPDQLHAMLLMKQAELQDRLRAEEARLMRVAARLKQLESDGHAYDVVLREIDPQWAAMHRGHILTYSGISTLFDVLFAHVAQFVPPQHVGLTAAIWHDDSAVDSGGEIDAEAAIYLKSPIPASAAVRVAELPALPMACVVHHGALKDLPAAYDALVRWVDAGGYRIAGANRELYHHYTLPARQDDPGYIVEIQLPVTREGG